MATDAENIAAIRSAALAELAAGPSKPSYSIDGQSVSWTEYYAHLMNRVEWCDKMATQNEPYEIRTTGWT
jgi:hypothetical protein